MSKLFFLLTFFSTGFLSLSNTQASPRASYHSFVEKYNLLLKQYESFCLTNQQSILCTDSEQLNHNLPMNSKENQLIHELNNLSRDLLQLTDSNYHLALTHIKNNSSPNILKFNSLFAYYATQDWYLKYQIEIDNYFESHSTSTGEVIGFAFFVAIASSKANAFLRQKLKLNHQRIIARRRTLLTPIRNLGHKGSALILAASSASYLVLRTRDTDLKITKSPAHYLILDDQKSDISITSKDLDSQIKAQLENIYKDLFLQGTFAATLIRSAQWLETAPIARWTAQTSFFKLKRFLRFLKLTPTSLVFLALLEEYGTPILTDAFAQTNIFIKSYQSLHIKDVSEFHRKLNEIYFAQTGSEQKGLQSVRFYSAIKNYAKFSQNTNTAEVHAARQIFLSEIQETNIKKSLKINDLFNSKRTLASTVQRLFCLRDQLQNHSSIFGPLGVIPSMYSNESRLLMTELKKNISKFNLDLIVLEKTYSLLLKIFQLAKSSTHLDLIKTLQGRIRNVQRTLHHVQSILPELVLSPFDLSPGLRSQIAKRESAITSRLGTLYQLSSQIALDIWNALKLPRQDIKMLHVWIETIYNIESKQFKNEFISIFQCQ